MTEKLYAALFYTNIKVPVKPLNAVIQGLYLLMLLSYSAGCCAAAFRALISACC